MGIVLSRDLEWRANGWETRTFLEACLPHLELAPALRETVEYCVESEIESIDLRGLPREALAQLEPVVDAVIASARRSGGADLLEPEYFPRYLARLRELKELLGEL